jgi:hypothetical protein
MWMNVALWALVIVIGLLWWSRHAANKRAQRH